jgi:intergrase/recombinase
MLDYVKGIIRSHPGECANAFIFATLTGLRAEEACQSIRLIRQNANNYYNSHYQVLEHFRYKDIFIGRSKKAFISLVDDQILDIARQSCDSWMAITSRLKRRNTPMHLSYCRKIFGTWLRKNGIETELIDMLQGRIPTTVFGKHYYRPSFNEERERIHDIVGSLRKQIQSAAG